MSLFTFRMDCAISAIFIYFYSGASSTGNISALVFGRSVAMWTAFAESANDVFVVDEGWRMEVLAELQMIR